MLLKLYLWAKKRLGNFLQITWNITIHHHKYTMWRCCSNFAGFSCLVYFVGCAVIPRTVRGNRRKFLANVRPCLARSVVIAAPLLFHCRGSVWQIFTMQNATGVGLFCDLVLFLYAVYYQNAWEEGSFVFKECSFEKHLFWPIDCPNSPLSINRQNVIVLQYLEWTNTCTRVRHLHLPEELNSAK